MAYSGSPGSDRLAPTKIPASSSPTVTVPEATADRVAKRHAAARSPHTVAMRARHVGGGSSAASSAATASIRWRSASGKRGDGWADDAANARPRQASSAVSPSAAPWPGLASASCGGPWANRRCSVSASRRVISLLNESAHGWIRGVATRPARCASGDARAKRGRRRRSRPHPLGQLLLQGLQGAVLQRLDGAVGLAHDRRGLTDVHVL